MVMILACSLDRNQILEKCDRAFKQVFYINGQPEEFITLMCIVCRQTLTIEKKAVKQDGDMWVYV